VITRKKKVEKRQKLNLNFTKI